MARDPYKYFRVEAREIVDQLGKGILDLEKGTITPELVKRLLRFAHTLKGAARVVKQKEIADDAHAIEDALAVLRDGVCAPERALVDRVLKLLDAIAARVSTLAAESSITATQGAEPRLPSESLRMLRADVEEIDALIDGVGETRIQLAALRRSIEPISRLRHLQQLLSDQTRSLRTRYASDVSTRTRAVAEEMGGVLASLEISLNSHLEQVDRELQQVREAADRLRLLPVELMFNVLERTVRDAAQSLEKRAAFEARGANIRLDAHVLGVVQNALVQIVRNSVAHGIESEMERTAAAKSSEGRVTLEISRRGNRISFVCRDDGRGVDLEAVRRAAQRRGSVLPETHQLCPADLIRVLLNGGLSTSRTVTEVAGRGIGLDVVREAAGSLGGEVSVHSDAGRGTAFTFVVPVSVASLDAVLVEADSQAAAIPLEAVRRSVLVRSCDIVHTVDGDSIIVGGCTIPFVPLSRSLRSAPPSRPAARRTWTTVIVGSDQATAAVGVDRLLRTETIVLRPLPRFCPADPIIAGVSLDAEGHPQLVLDPEALVLGAHRASRGLHSEAVRPLPILIIDDSLTTRMLEQSILESAGYEVDVAVSGEEALRKARRKPYALFLVDVEMAGMDGFEFITQIHADPGLRKVPAILVTSRNAPEDKRRGVEVGARGYVVKSEFDQSDLLERIRQLVVA